MVRGEWLYGTGLMPFACCQPGNANEHQPHFLNKEIHRKKKENTKFENANEHQPHFLTKEIPRKKKENTKLGDISLIREC